MPLAAGGESIGVIAVQSDTPYAFQTSDLRMLMVLTSQAAGAIRNAQLYEQAQERNRQLQLVSEVSQQVTAVQPLHDLFNQIVTSIHFTFGYYAVNIFTLDERDNRLVLRASSHPGFRDRAPRLERGQGLVGWVAQNARTALVANATLDERYYDDGVLNETRAELTVPLIMERRVVGVLDIQSDQTDAFTHDDTIVLETLASQVALAIQEAESYAAERRQRERLNALTEASRAVVSLLNIDDLLDEVVDLVTDYFGYDRTHIFLREGDAVVFRAGSGVHSGRWAIERLTHAFDEQGIIAKAARSGLTIVSNDVTHDPDYVPGPGVEDTRSEMAIPIRMSRQTLGVLDIQSTEINGFAPEDAALAEALSDTVAIALRNATLYAREKRRRIMAESLREVSTVLGASLEVDNVLDGILQGLSRVINVNSSVIVLFDADSKVYRISALQGKVHSESLINTVIPLDADLKASIEAIFHPEPVPANGDGPDTVRPSRRSRWRATTIPSCRSPWARTRSATWASTTWRATSPPTTSRSSTPSPLNRRSPSPTPSCTWPSARKPGSRPPCSRWPSSTARAISLDEVLQTVARITPLLVGVEWCGVLLAHNDGYRVVEVEGVDADVVQELIGMVFTPETWPPLAEMMETGETILLGPKRLAQRPEAIAHLNLHIEQGVMLPLYAKGEIVGALLIGQQNRRGAAHPAQDRAGRRDR